MATIFSRIIDGDLPGHFVWRDRHCVAFLSINPISVGHTLVVPVEEVDHWLDLPVATAAHLTEVAHHIGSVQQYEFDSPRVGLIIAGFEVPHTHLHVLPIWTMADLDFANADATVDHDNLAALAARLRTGLNAAGHSDHVAAS
jgi:diadenosine tetraphosphate (Ap4A) HIT family hydrolase